MEKLVIIEPDKMKYNGKDIFFKTNKGEFSMSYGDAWELAFCFFDATISMTSNVEKIMEEIDKKYNMGRY